MDAARSFRTALGATLALAVGAGCTSPTSTPRSATTTTVGANPGASSSSVTAANVSVAASLTDNLVGGRFANATVAFDTTMRAALSPTGLQSAWAQVTGSLGTFKQKVAPITRSVAGYP